MWELEKNPAALYFEKILGLCAFDLGFPFFCRRYSRDERRILSASKVFHEVLLDCIFLTLKSVECTSYIPNSSYPLNSRHNQDSGCQTKMSAVAEGSKSEANQLWFSPPVFSHSAYPLHLELQILLCSLCSLSQICPSSSLSGISPSSIVPLWI